MMMSTLEPSLLLPPELDDPSLFAVRKAVPVLDVHQHPTKGDVTLELLELIAENSNRRADRGNPAMLLIGHTDDQAPETDQPPVVGYAKNFRIGEHLGEPCLLADLHIHRELLPLAMTFPHRSVERFKSDLEPEANFIDAVSLLRRTPERDLGLLTYRRARSVPGAELVCYARDWRPPGERRPVSLAERDAAIRIATREGLGFDDALAEVRRTQERQVARYSTTAGGRHPGPARPPGMPSPLAEHEVAPYVAFCTKQGITNHAVGLRRFRQGLRFAHPRDR